MSGEVKIIQLRLDGVHLEVFERTKRELGLNSDNEVIRYIITQYSRQNPIISNIDEELKKIKDTQEEFRKKLQALESS